MDLSWWIHSGDGRQFSGRPHLQVKRARHTDRGPLDVAAHAHISRKDISRHRHQWHGGLVRHASTATHHDKVRIAWTARVQRGGAFVTSLRQGTTAGADQPSGQAPAVVAATGRSDRTNYIATAVDKIVSARHFAQFHRLVFTLIKNGFCGGPRGVGHVSLPKCNIPVRKRNRCPTMTTIAKNSAATSAAYSCRRTLNNELWTFRAPLYSMKPSFLNLFMKKLTRGRVVPIISASVS